MIKQKLVIFAAARPDEFEPFAGLYQKGSALHPVAGVDDSQLREAKRPVRMSGYHDPPPLGSPLAELLVVGQVFSRGCGIAPIQVPIIERFCLFEQRGEGK